MHSDDSIVTIETVTLMILMRC